VNYKMTEKDLIKKIKKLNYNKYVEPLVIILLILVLVNLFLTLPRFIEL